MKKSLYLLVALSGCMLCGCGNPPQNKITEIPSNYVAWVPTKEGSDDPTSYINVEDPSEVIGRETAKMNGAYDTLCNTAQKQATEGCINLKKSRDQWHHATKLLEDNHL